MLIKTIFWSNLTEDQARRWLMLNDREAADFWRDQKGSGLKDVIYENLESFGPNQADVPEFFEDGFKSFKVTIDEDWESKSEYTVEAKISINIRSINDEITNQSIVNFNGIPCNLSALKKIQQATAYAISEIEFRVAASAMQVGKIYRKQGKPIYFMISSVADGVVKAFVVSKLGSGKDVVFHVRDNAEINITSPEILRIVAEQTNMNVKYLSKS